MGNLNVKSHNLLSLTIMATGLHAASIGLTFSAADMGGAANSQVLYFGTITNNSASDVYLTSESVSVNGFAVDTSPFDTTLAGLLPGGSADFVSPLFNVLIPDASANPYGTYTGSYNLLGGDNPGDTNVLAGASFLLQVVPSLPSDFLTLDPSTKYGPPGGALTFGGQIVNNTASVLYLVSASLSTPSQLTGDTTPFLNSPFSLNPGTFEYNLPFFTIAIAPDAPLGPLPAGTLSLSGGADPSAQDNLGLADFFVVVTPEPGTWMLMGGGVLAAAIRRWVRR